MHYFSHMSRILKNTALLLSLFLVLFFACDTQQSAKEKPQSPSFDWLVGDWQRTNDIATNQTSEYWEKQSATEFAGLGCALSAGDTTFLEKIRLYRSTEGWYYEVTGVNEEPVPFRITAVQKEGFIAENPDNEFPKIIRYRRAGDNLTASVSADGNEIFFDFVKSN